MKLTDSQVLSICIQELQDSSALRTNELSDQRAASMDRYLGEPMGNEVEGRSQIVTREIFSTIEWLKPSLMRIFADVDNLVRFEPVGPEDEDQAKQETEVCNHVFWQHNRGFYNLLTFITDGLLSKTGVLKVWWDDTEEEEREEYHGLDMMAVAELLSDQEWTREVLEAEQAEEGISLVVKATRKKGRVCIEPVPPEEFGVERNARSPYAKDSSFVWHRVRKTRSDLIEEGYDRAKVEALPGDEDVEGLERLARYHLSDEIDQISHAHSSMQQVWVTECYVRLDRNDDGIGELLKVTLASSSGYASGATLLDVEETDRIPFSTFSPIIITHKFHGLSVADVLRDLEDIKTALLRGALDAMYLANNPRLAVNGRVNLDDLLVSRPGGIVRTEGNDPPGNHLYPMPQQPPAADTFGLLEYLDQLRQQRTGAGDDVPALEKNSLANVNPTVAAIAYDAARSKIELLARIIAEIGLVPLFRDVHELMQKHSHQALTVRLRNGWTRVNPSEWRRRENVQVQVGIGQASRERRLMTMEQLLGKQMEIGSNGGMGQLIMPGHVYNAITDWTDAMGIDPGRYWQDPAQVPPQPPAPDAAMMAMQLHGQIEGKKAENDQAKIKLEAYKIQQDGQLRQAEFVVRQQEAQARAQVERLKAELASLRLASESETSVIRAQAEAEKAAKSAELKSAELLLRDTQERNKQNLEWAKAALSSSTTITVEQMRQAGMYEAADAQERAEREKVGSARREVEERQGMSSTIAELKAALMELMASNAAPRVIERDPSGRAVAIGGKAIRRNALDLIESIG